MQVTSTAECPSADKSARGLISNENFVSNSSYTEIRVKPVKHQWTVKNFSHCNQEYLESFISFNHSDTIFKWSVKIYPRGNGESNKDYVFLCLNHVAQQHGVFMKNSFKASFSLQNVHGERIDMRVHPSPNHSDYVTYAKRDAILPKIHPQDVLMVTTMIHVVIDTVTESANVAALQTPDSKNIFVNDMDALYEKGTYTDFSICVGGTIIRTHRCILAARSKVFAAMLVHGTEESRKELFRRWANIKRWWDYQPYDLIRRYFGEKIALYFVWLGHYTVCLFPISILGILCVVYGFWTLNTDIPSKEICNGPASDLMMCPNCDVGCDFWKLGSSCTYARVTHLFDNGCTVLFAALMSLWATLFLEAWKRRQGELSWRWNLCDFDLEEDVIRPEFEICAKKMKLNPITQEMEPHLPFSERVLRLIASSVTVLFCLCLVLAFTFSIILYRIIVSHHFDRHETTYVRTNASVVASFSAALLNLLIVMILDQAYAKLAWRLTNWEFPRTESEFENSYTFKVFLFQFINYYSSLFYIAFFKGRFAKLPGPTEDTILGYRPEACDPNGCMVELLIQLAIIMVGKQFINNVMEIGVPMMYNYLRKKKSTGTAALTSAMAWARDFLLNPVPQDFLLGEYLEMILQYGFVTLFVAAFPLAPAFALLNNIIEVRLDAYKYVVTYRRPLPSRTKDLGVWMHILVGISRMAVLTNACVIAFTSDFVPRMVYRHLFSTNSSLEGFVGGELSMFNPFSFCRDNNMSIACNLTSCRYEDYRKPPCTANPYATLDRWSPEFPMVLSNRTLWPSTGFEDCDDSYSTNTKWWIVLAMRILFVLLFENLVFTVKMLFEWFVPDLPFKVHVQIQREKYLAKQALYDNAFKEQSPKHLSRRHKRNKE